MRKLLLLLLPVSCYALSVTAGNSTSQQFTLTETGYSGACTVEVSSSPLFSPVVADTNGTEYTGASTDTGRGDTLTISGPTRIVTIGHLVGDRSLAANSTYYWRVSGCGGTVTGSANTTSLTSGSGQGEITQANAANPWNMGLAQYALTNPTSTPDPRTGVNLIPANNPSHWTWREGCGTSGCSSSYTAFSYWSGGTGWTNLPSVGAPFPEASSTVTTANTNSVDLYSPGCCNYPGDPWNGISFDDLGVVPWASATNTTGRNAQFTLCIILNPVSGCIGTPITITATASFGQVHSGSSDPDQPFPSTFPQAFFSGWGLTAPIGLDHGNVTGNLSCTGSVCTIPTAYLTRSSLAYNGGNPSDGHFPATLFVGNKIYIAGSSPTCTNNLCTVASVQSGSQITIVESFASPITNANFTALGWGVRIQKVTATGSLTVGLAFKQAGARGIETPGSGGWYTSPAGFTSGDGHYGFLAIAQATAFNSPELYFVSGDGTVRPIWTLRVPTTASCFSPAGSNNQPTGQGFPLLNAGLSFDPTNPKKFYIAYNNTLGSQSIFAITYTGDAYQCGTGVNCTVPGNYQMSQDGNTPLYSAAEGGGSCDYTSWQNLMLPGSSDLQTQIAAYTPTYNSSLYGTNFSLSGISGTTAFFTNQYSGQNNPAWLAVVDLSVNPAVLRTMIHTLDGSGLSGATGLIGTPSIRWGGHHNTTTVTAVPNTAQFTEDIAQNGNSSVTSISSVAFGGSGYAVNDTFTISGGAATGKVTAVSGGVVTGASLTGGGTGYNPATYSGVGTTATSGVGTGLTLNIKVGVLLAGPFAFTPNAILASDGVTWNTNTAMSWPSSGSLYTTCPGGNPYASWSYSSTSGGASVTNNCITLRLHLGGACDILPSTLDVLNFTACPWNPAYTEPTALAVGDIFTDINTSFPCGSNFHGDCEHFRVVQITSDASWMYVVAMRSAAFDYCAPGSGSAQPVYFPGIAGPENGVNSDGQFQHSNGWTAMMLPDALQGCTSDTYFYTYSGSPTIYEESYLLAGHGGVFPGTTGSGYSILSASQSRVSSTFSGLFAMPTKNNTLIAPTFHGQSLAIGGGSIQSYVDSPGSQNWMSDANSMNGNGGGLPEYRNTVGGPVTLTSVSGTVYQITPIVNSGGFPLNNSNYKSWLLQGWAGRYNLKDISGPGSNSAGTSFSVCYAYLPNECVTGSTTGNLYVNVPAAFNSGSCITGQSWLLAPCVIFGFPSGGGFRLQNISSGSDTTGVGTLLVSYSDTIPGELYPYTASTPLPDGTGILFSGHEAQGWNATGFLAQLPAYHTQSPGYQDYKGISVVIPGGSNYAKVQFGYSRYIGPDANPTSGFFCTARADGCNTNTNGSDPFSYDSGDTGSTPTSCLAGCTITIHAVGPNLLYYRVAHSSDGTTWSYDDTQVYALGGTSLNPNTISYAPVSGFGIQGAGIR